MITNLFKENKMRKEMFETVVEMIESPDYSKRMLSDMVIIQAGKNRDYARITFEVKKDLEENKITIEKIGWNSGISGVDSKVLKSCVYDEKWNSKMYKKLYSLIHCVKED